MQRTATLLVVACAIASLGCGGSVYRPSERSGFESDQSSEIDDDDVRKAFDARPQMRDNVQVAYYSFDATKVDDIDKMLKALPGVTGTYRIPPLMVTGERQYDAQFGWRASSPVSVKKLRLLAARARCDLLVIFDYGNKTVSSANSYAALGILVVPLLIAPFLKVEASSYMDSFVIDTRNGYLYGHVTMQQNDEADRVNLYENAADDLTSRQWPKLLMDTEEALKRLLTSERGARNGLVREDSSNEPRGNVDAGSKATTQ